MQKLDYEGMGETPTLIEGLEERVNALESAATDPDSEAQQITLTNHSSRLAELEKANTNLTERVVYMEGIINCLVDHYMALGHSMTKPVLVPGDDVPVQAAPRYAGPTTDDTAPYAAI
jgi:hypothetical protein